MKISIHYSSSSKSQRWLPFTSTCPLLFLLAWLQNWKPYGHSCIESALCCCRAISEAGGPDSLLFHSQKVVQNCATTFWEWNRILWTDLCRSRSVHKWTHHKRQQNNLPNKYSFGTLQSAISLCLAPITRDGGLQGTADHHPGDCILKLKLFVFLKWTGAA